MLLAALGSVRIGKNCDLGLEKCCPRPQADWEGSIFKTSVTVFPYTDLQAGQKHIFTWYKMQYTRHILVIYCSFIVRRI